MFSFQGNKFKIYLPLEYDIHRLKSIVILLLTLKKIPGTSVVSEEELLTT